MIKTQQLSPAMLAGFYAFPFQENSLIGAWEAVAVSMQDLAHSIVHTREEFEALAANNPLLGADRAYLSRQLIVMAAETVEMLGSALLRFRGGRPVAMTVDRADLKRYRGFQQASNDELLAVFGAAIEGKEALEFLGIPLPPPNSEALRAASDKLILAAGATVSGLGRYWIDVIGKVRWFRHLPVSLTLDQVVRLESRSNSQLLDVLRKAEEMRDELEEVACIPDNNRFDHNGLVRTDANAATAVFRTAIALLFTLSGNQLLAEHSPNPDEKLPKVPRLFLSELTAQERAAIEQWDGYVIAF